MHHETILSNQNQKGCNTAPYHQFPVTQTCLFQEVHRLCYGSVGLCAIHNSLALYRGDVIYACHTNKTKSQ